MSDRTDISYVHFRSAVAIAASLLRSRNTSGRVMMLILSILTRKVSKLKREPNGRMETIKWRQVQRIMKKIYFSTDPAATPVNTSLRYDDAVLAASDALCATAEEQEQKILLARCGKWHPLALSLRTDFRHFTCWQVHKLSHRS